MTKVTKSCYVDANVLIYFHNKLSISHNQAKAIIKQLVEHEYTIYISSLIIDEYLYSSFRLSTEARELRLKKLRRGLNKILQIPGLCLVQPPLEPGKQKMVLAFMRKFGLKPRDAYHLLVMKHNKINTFATFDSDFNEVFKKKMLKDAFKVYGGGSLW